MNARSPRVLVPLDGSRLAESALDAALEIALAWGARLTLLHVLEARPPERIHGEPHLADLEGARRYLDGWAAKLRDKGADVDVHVHAPGVRGVAEALADHADELDADLLVMCAHGRGGWRDLVLGNIAQQTLKRSVRPVLLMRVPTRAQERALSGRPWGVAIEPQRHGPRAFPFVAELGRAMHAPLRLLTVIPTRDTLPPTRRGEGRLAPGAVARVLDLEAEDARDYLEGLVGELRAAGGEVSVGLLRGDPVREMLSAVRDEDLAMLVVATHRRAGIPGLMAGGFAAAVVGRTSCPLLLVPLASRDRPAAG